MMAGGAGRVSGSAHVLPVAPPSYILSVDVPSYIAMQAAVEYPSRSSFVAAEGDPALHLAFSGGLRTTPAAKYLTYYTHDPF